MLDLITDTPWNIVVDSDNMQIDIEAFNVDKQIP